MSDLELVVVESPFATASVAPGSDDNVVAPVDGVVVVDEGTPVNAVVVVDEEPPVSVDDEGTSSGDKGTSGSESLGKLSVYNTLAELLHRTNRCKLKCQSKEEKKKEKRKRYHYLCSTP